MIDQINIPLNVAIVSLISITALVCSILIAYFVPGNQLRGKKYLVGYYFLFSLTYFLIIFYYGEYYPNIDWHLIESPVSELNTIVLFLFIHKSLIENYKIKSWYYLLYTTFILTLLRFGMYVLGIRNSIIDSIFNSEFYTVFSFIYDIFILLLLVRTVLWYKKVVMKTESSFENFQYKWVSFVLYATIIFSFFPLTWSLIVHYTDIPIESQLNYVIAGMITLTYLIVVTLKTLKNFDHTQALNISEEMEEIMNSEAEKQVSDIHLDVYNKILEKIEQEKIYKQSDINLNQVAHMIENRPRLVSEAINACYKNNFYHFINSFRIKEAKQILENSVDPKLTIAEVMYEVGYNSKSSFNTTFKKQLGMTPSEFRKKYM